MDQQKAYRLAAIIIRVRLGNATDDERAELLAWLDQDEANRQTYKRIIRGEAIRERILTEEAAERQTDFEQLRRSVVKRLIPQRRRMGRVVRIAAVAACVAVVAGLSWWLLRTPAVEPTPVAALQPDARVKLILHSGEQINLEKGVPENLRLKSARIVDKEGTLAYEPQENGTSDAEEWNKIVTSVGGEYFFILSDGTKVWVNAVSELEYPVDFKGEQRLVKLKGEAYFEVRPDAEHPFVVVAGDVHTRVLGTSFNVQAYPDEAHTTTTLLTGKVQVGVENAGQAVTLEPGQEAVWERGTDRLTVAEVNAEEAVAWRYGDFIFNEQEVEVVLRMLARWYDVEFVFDRERMAKHTFTGRLSKQESLTTSLEWITFAGGPQFRREGRVVYVKE